MSISIRALSHDASGICTMRETIFEGSSSAGFDLSDRCVEHLIWGRGVLEGEQCSKRGKLARVHVGAGLDATADGTAA